MISSEVQRTLVKSPPELWSELSDPASLARHLGELGEIRVVRVEPEKTVEWAAENTTGTVSIQPSGWGTKVTLSVTRELVAPAISAGPQAVGDEPQAVEPQAVGDEPQAVEPQAVEPQAVEPQAVEDEPPVPDAEAESEETPASAANAHVEVARTEIEAAEPEPVEAQPADEPAPAPRRGFFARLFGRRRRVEAAPVLAPRAFAAVSEALAHQAIESRAFEIPTGPAAAVEATTVEVDAPEPADTPASGTTEPDPDIAAELMAAEEVAAEEVAAEEVTAVLAAVLDRLGAAHHRPFSRS